MSFLDDIIPAVMDTVDELVFVDATLTRRAAVYDPDTDTDNAAAATSHALRVSPLAGFNFTNIDEDAIKSRDAHCIVNATGLAIVPDVQKDTIEVHDKSFRIEICQPIYSGDDVVAYKLKLRV